MRSKILTALGGLLALWAALAAPQPAANDAPDATVQRVERGALVLENIPPIPDELAATLFQYQQARVASFAGWLPAPHGMLITTRFGQTRQVHRVTDPLGDRQQLTFFPEAVSNIVTVSDPERPGFLFGKDSGGDEHYQIYYQDLASGRQSRLTHGGARNTAPRWSNMGEYFAYSTTQRNGRDTDIHIYERATGTSRPVLQSKGLWYTLDWSPDDRQLLVLRYVSVGESYPHILDLDSGELVPFRPSIYPVSFGTARFSRDGRGVFYTSDEDSEFRHLRFHDLQSGDSKLLTGDIPWDVTSFALSGDGRYLAFVTNADGRSELHLRAVRDWRPIAAPALPMGVVRGLRFSEDGWRIGFTLNSPRTPGDVYSFRVGETQLTRWTKSEVGGLSTDEFAVPELIRYPTFDLVDGSMPADLAAPPAPAAEPAAAAPPRRTIPAFVYRPAGPGPHPVLILMHGGPASQARPTFNPVLQFWVNELGLAVIAPNVRGSTGYGREFKMLDDGRLREDSVRDVGALLDWIDSQPELDGGRVGIIGGSYGGYMVMASMIHYGPRLRAGVNVVGISNFVTFLENTGIYRRDRRRLEYGDERDPEMRAFLASISPTTHADRIVQPLFIAQGANDPRVPQSEADQMAATIRSHGGEVWYFLARDEGHGFRKKSNRDYYNNAVALFLHTHLLNGAPPPGEPPPAEAFPADLDEPAAPVEVPDEDAAEESDDAMHAPLEPPSQDSEEEPLDPVPEPPNGQGALAQVQQQFR